MPHADLTLDGWTRLSDEAAARTAAAIAREAGARLTGVRAHAYHGRSHRVALVERDGIAFALVPGGEARLGHDPDRFTPTARQQADFDAAAADYDLAQPLGGFVAASTSPDRVVTLPARLVAVHSTDVGDLPLDDDEVDDHATLVAGLGALGLRLPTPDEWEYACGAGATTLFRWGDDYPEGEPYGEVPLIQEPNLFGLVIGHDPYRAEFTTDPAVLCGGDGGSALCGGAGDFLSWLSLATAYRDPYLAETVDEGGLILETPARPVLPL